MFRETHWRRKTYNEYLKMLSVGKHTLKVSLTNGKEVDTNFEIEESLKIKDETPKTGINICASQTRITLRNIELYFSTIR